MAVPLIIIQARLSSKRFPNKVMATLGNLPVWRHVADTAIAAARDIGGSACFAIPYGQESLATALRDYGIAVWTGPEDDVLTRFYLAYKASDNLDVFFDPIVRLTCDCPLIDPQVIVDIVEQYNTLNGDTHGERYVAQTMSPDGTDCEVFSASLLESANREAKTQQEREHVTPWIIENASTVRINRPYRGKIKYSVDTPADLALCEKILATRKGPSWRECVEAAESTAAPETASTRLWAEALTVIPGGCCTASKSYQRHAEGVGPSHCTWADGAIIHTVDGQDLIDWTMGLGAVTLGYRLSEHALSSLSLSYVREVELAKRVTSWFGTDMVRFLKTGSDACSAAVRLCRAWYEKKKEPRWKVLRCGYHGWHDFALNSDYKEKLGIPPDVRDLTISVPYNDVAALEMALFLHKPACFILELISLTEPQPGYLQRVIETCHRYGTFVIADETITGMRLERGAAVEYNVEPDLLTIGKGMANGQAISCVTGKALLMEMFNDTHISGTYYGEVGPIFTAIDTISEIEREGYYKKTRAASAALVSGIQQIRNAGLEPFTMLKKANYHWFRFDWKTPELETLFQQECCTRGVLYTGSHFPSLCHTPDIVSKTLEVYKEAAYVVSAAIHDDTVMAKLRCKVNRLNFKRNA